MKKIFWLIFSLLLISRFFFLAHYPHFYDSPEYYRESLSNNFWQSIATSHKAIHPLYLFLTQIFQKISIGLIGEPQIWVISLISAFFGILGILAWYFLVKRLFSNKISLFSLIPLIFFPHLWLIQTNILHETIEQGLFLLGLLFLDLFLEKRKIYWVILVVISWGLATFNFLGIIVWFPAALGLIIFRSKAIRKDLIFFFISAFLSLGLALAGLYATLALAIPEPAERMGALLLGEGGVLFFWTLLDILRVLRNDFLILFYGYSVAAILGGLIAFVYLIKKKKYRLLIFVSLFLAAFGITGKFWYGGLYGRWSALVAYPLALLLALIPWRKVYLGLIVFLVISFLPTFLAYQKTPIPEVQASLINQSGITGEDLLILSDYQRPQLPYGNALYIVGASQRMIEEEIKTALEEEKRVFISQQAITFPYWQYDGQEIHIISRGSKEKAHLKEFLEDKEVRLIIEDENYPLLSIYQLLAP